jgi:uncharacterized protein (DUF58 family)
MAAHPASETAAPLQAGMTPMPAASPLRQRINRWISARTPRVPGPWRIDRRRVYILPTRYGYGYGILLFVMLLGAMNYSNSMAFALTFLLAGMGLLAMHHTHGNLVNISVRARRVPPVFCGETARYTLELENGSATARYALNATWPGQKPHCHIDLLPGVSASLELTLATERRGWRPAPRFAVATEFPVGLFRAWTWIELDMAALVYPKPAPHGERPPATSGGNGNIGGSRSGADEFAGLRPYQRGDGMRAIHWKSLAKQRNPMVKQFVETMADELWLDWSALPAAWGTEQRISQLTRWLLDAETSGRPYALRLPGFTRTPALGEPHRHECLQALALFQNS